MNFFCHILGYVAEMQIILLLCGVGDIQVGTKKKEELEWGLNVEGKMAWLTPLMKAQGNRFEGVMLNHGKARENVVDEGRYWGMWNRRMLSTTVAGDLAFANVASKLPESLGSYEYNSFGKAVNLPAGVGPSYRDTSMAQHMNLPGPLKI